MGNLNDEKPRKVAFCVSTLAIIWTSLLVFVVAVVLAIVALFLVFSYRDEFVTSQAALQNATTRDHQGLQVQLDSAYSVIQALQLQLNNSNSLIVNLQSQLLNTSQETRRIVSNMYEDLQYQLNNTAHFLQSKLNNVSDSLQSRVVGVSSQLQQIRNETQEIQEQITSNNFEIQTLQSEVANLSQECPGLDSSQPATSCQQVLNCNASSSSGSYWIQLEDGSTAQRYCNMNRACGGKAGGWMRVAMLDMRESSNQCPSGLIERVHQSGPGRLCGINLNDGGCSQVFFPTNLHYDQVCGKIIAYQFGHLDALWGRSNPTIDDNYLDGISVSHSSNPRKHIWSFIACNSEAGPPGRFGSCPCARINASASSIAPYEFIGNHYFCDTGTTDESVRSVLYADDPLWDGAGCGPASTCCSLNNPPWFFKQLSSSTSENIEMRVCSDFQQSEEDVRVQQIEIYVR